MTVLRGWAIGILIAVIFVAGVLWFGIAMENNLERKDSEFLYECGQKGGTPVDFKTDHHRPACIIDGEKFYR